MPGPEDKKNSGSGHAQPLDGRSSSASSSSQSGNLKESDFLTGRPPGKPATSTMSSSSSAPALPVRGKPSLGENIVNKHLKQQHLQVMPVFKGAKEYAESLRESDEAYRQAHALHPLESLQSVNIRVSNEADRKRGGPIYEMDNPYCIRPFPSMVTSDFKFHQREMKGVGPGLCMALSVSFILYRRLGYDCKKIYALFRQNEMAFVHLQAKYDAIRLSRTQEVFSAILQVAEESLLKGELPGISPVSPAKRYLQGSSPAHGAAATPFDKKNISHPTLENRSAPARANALFKSLSFLAIVGHFELDRDRPLTQRFRNWIKVPSIWSFFGLSDYQISNVYQNTARGVTSTWGIPRMDDTTQEARTDAGSRSSQTEEDIWNPHIATHLFAAMERVRRRKLWNGEVLESLPYFLISIVGDKEGHAIVVEFNTDARDETITTPRGVFDPGDGWASLSQGYCSLDLDMLLQDYFLTVLNLNNTKFRMDPPGGLIACQLQMITNGTTTDPAYIAQWGGLPWMRTGSK